MKKGDKTEGREELVSAHLLLVPGDNVSAGGAAREREGLGGLPSYVRKASLLFAAWNRGSGEGEKGAGTGHRAVRAHKTR